MLYTHNRSTKLYSLGHAISNVPSSRNVGEELAEEGDQVGAAVATAQTKIISQVKMYT